MEQLLLGFNAQVEIYTHLSISSVDTGHEVVVRDRSDRRRLMAILRMGCRVLGLKRKGRTLGLPGLARNAAAMAAGAALIATLGSSAGYAASGIFINDHNDDGCMEVMDSGDTKTALAVRTEGKYCHADNGTQTDRVVFFGPIDGIRPNGLSLGGDLHVTGTANIYNTLNANSTLNAKGDVRVYRGKIWLNSQDLKSLTIGDDAANAAGKGSIAFGNNTQSTSMGSIAIGPDARAGRQGDKSDSDWANIAIGANAISYDKDGVALGRSSITADNMTGATALGAEAKANYANDVALGYQSVSGQSASTSNVTINGVVYNFAGSTANGMVSIGSDSLKRQLTNLAAGRNSATSTDGVNGSQLFATNSAVNALGVAVNSITTGALGGLVQQATPEANITVGAATQGTAVDFRSTAGARRLLNVANGKVEKDSLEAVNGGQLFDTNTQVSKHEGDITNITLGRAGLVQQANPGANLTVGAATDGVAVDFGGTAGRRKLLNIANGTLSATSFDAVNGSQLFQTNSRVTETEGDITNITLGKAGLVQQAAPGANLTVGAATDGVAVDFGGTAGPRKLLNIAAGTLSATSFDAVNGSQLNNVDQRVNTLYDSLAMTIGSVSTTSRATGLMGLPSFTIQGQSATDVTDAFAKVNDQFSLQTNVISSLNDISVQYASKDTNGNGIIDAGEVDYTSVLLRGAGGTTIGNVANGAVTATSTEAINGSQLFGVSRNTATAFGGGASVDVNGNWTGPAYTIQKTTFNNVGDALTSLDGQVTKNTTDITNIDDRVTINEGAITTINTKLGDINTGKAGLVQQADPEADLTVGAATGGVAVDLTGTKGPRKLRGLAAGELSSGSTEGVNGGQLFETNANVTNIDDRVTINEGAITTINTKLGDINSGAAGLVQQSAAGENITIAKDLDGAAIDIGGTFAGKKGPRKLINVDRGVDDNDAVNFGQLKELETAGTDAVKRLGDAAVKYAWDDKNKNGALDADEVVDPNKVRLAGTNGTVISNVGKGLVDQTSTEAVNGSQLFGVSKSVATILGGKADVDADGNVTQPTYRIQTKDVHTVEDALTSLDGQVTVNTTNIASNTSAINGLKQDALQWDPIAAVFSARHGTDATSRISNVKAGTEDTDAVNFSQLKELQSAGTDAVKRFGDRSAKYAWIDTNNSKAFDEGDEVDFTRLELEGPVGTGTIINNVGRGEVSLSSMQAINGAQLWYTSNSFATYLGGGASINAGVLTAPEYKIASIDKDGKSGATNTFNNVGDALGLLNSNITNVNSVVTDLNSRFVASQTDALRWDPTKESFTAVHGGGTTTDKTTGGGSSAPLVTPPEVGQPVAVEDLAGEKITDLQAGDVSATSTDAVNGSQLHATNTAVKTLDDVAVKYASVNGSKTNQVALSGADPNAPVLISNVDAGKSDTDAVNLRQLKDTVQEAVISNNQYNQYLDQSKSYTNNYADQKAATTLADAKAYTDERFNELSSDIGSVRSEARQAAAIGLAAASLRFDGTPGKISVAMGGGAWRGQGALAYGAGYTSESGKVRANISGVHSGGEFGIGAGISFTLN